MKKIALYPGTFDPITNGHLDIIKRSAKLFDEVIVAVALSEGKKPMFSLEKRIELINGAIKDLQNIKVVGFDNLTVELAHEHNSNILVRGLRSVSDFEYELNLSYLNNSLDEKIETIYMMPKLNHAFVSSSIIRNLLQFNGKTSHLLPESVEKHIKELDICTLH
ncbi:MAG: pantetheine-phosphate adenylyltransferase [Helicobacteraceae bacterium]|nr:pantetheine-phosphate adenylyltransferase [Helicobacteraceae bacterium]